MLLHKLCKMLLHNDFAYWDFVCDGQAWPWKPSCQESCGTCTRWARTRLHIGVWTIPNGNSRARILFLVYLWPIRDNWNRLERLHPFVLELSYADGPAQHKDTWHKSMRQIRTLPGVDSLTPVHDKIRILHESDCIALPPRTTLLSIVIPSSRLLDKFDPHRAMSIDDLRETIRPSRHLFEDMLANPI